MATVANDMPKRKRDRYRAAYRAGALALAARIGVAATASSRPARHADLSGAGEGGTRAVRQRPRAPLREATARLKRQLAEETEEVEILGKTAA